MRCGGTITFETLANRRSELGRKLGGHWHAGVLVLVPQPQEQEQGERAPPRLVGMVINLNAEPLAVAVMTRGRPQHSSDGGVAAVGRRS